MKVSLLLYLFILSLNGFSQSAAFEWAKQMGGTDREIGLSIAVDAIGNSYTVGFFNGLVDFDPGPGITNLNSSGGPDIFIQKLDSDGNLLWVRQMGGTHADRGASIALDESGNIYTTGDFMGTVDFDPDTGIVNLTSNGYFDVFIHKLDANGNFVWVKQMGGTGYDTGNSICVDNKGIVHVTGFFEKTVDFDPDVSVSNLTSNGKWDVFIQKLDANGSLLWVVQNGSAEHDLGLSITSDRSGNVYTTGSFMDTIDFNPGIGINDLASDGLPDIFIQKLDSSGSFVWARQIEGLDFHQGSEVRTDDSSNVYLTGFFSGTIDIDPEFGIQNFTSVGRSDIFIQKLDANGRLRWARQIGGTGSDYGHSIALDASANLYITGSYSSTVDFDPGVGIYNQTSKGARDIYIQKIDSHGNFIWVKTMGGYEGDHTGHSIALDDARNVYTTGAFWGTVDFDPGVGVNDLIANGDYDIFIHKLQGSGIELFESNFQNKIVVYPNPTNGEFSIDLGELKSKPSLTITDLNGKTIQSITYFEDQLLNLRLNEPAGVYLLLIESNDRKAYIRLVKK